MKESPQIDQLLNGYVDGALTPRQQTELQRLITHDPEIGERLDKLQKCKLLISSLPVAEAPADMLERIKTSLQPETSVPEEQPVSDNRVGAAQLMFRRVLAAAAMIVLVTALAIIVYSIMAPPKTADRLVVREGMTVPTIDKQPVVPEILTAESGSTASKNTAAIVEQPTAAINGKTALSANLFNATLELRTSKLLAADIAVKKVLEKDGAKDFATLSNGADEYVYSLHCGTGRLDSVLAGLEGIWDKFTSATLIFETTQAEQPVVIENVTTWQIAEIAAQYNPERRLKAAQYYAIMNNVQEFLPQRQTLNVVDEDIFDLIDMPKPKPVLTKDEQDSATAESKPQINLTVLLKTE